MGGHTSSCVERRRKRERVGAIKGPTQRSRLPIGVEIKLPGECLATQGLQCGLAIRGFRRAQKQWPSVCGWDRLARCGHEGTYHHCG